MQRVRFIFFMRTLSRPLIMETVLIGIFLLYASVFVSFKNVFANVGGKLFTEELFSYLLSAVINTELTVQILLVFLFAVSAFFFNDAARKFKHARRSLMILSQNLRV